jgi:uncharacterized membrane protein
MITLAALIFIFGIIHLNPAIAPWKAHAVGVFGKAYGAVYGVLSLLLLAACMWAFRQVDPVPLYNPPHWGRYANFILSLLGFISLGIFLFRGSWRNTLRYPMALGVGLWATGHLLANGDQRSTVFFAGLAAFALLFACLKATGGPAVASEVRNGHNLLSVMGGFALYGIATQLHAVVTGAQIVTLQ